MYIYIYIYKSNQVISRKIVLVVCGREIKNSWLNPFLFIIV